MDESQDEIQITNVITGKPPETTIQPLSYDGHLYINPYSDRGLTKNITELLNFMKNEFKLREKIYVAVKMLSPQDNTSPMFTLHPANF